MQNLIQNILVVSIFALKLAQAMKITLADLSLIKREPVQLLRSILAAEVITPFITVVVILLTNPLRATQIGLALAAASPAAPLFISSAIGAGGRVAYVASLQFTLSSLAVITTPLLLSLFGLILGFNARVSPLAVAQQVGFALFLPTCLGMFARSRFPAFAQRAARFLTMIGGCAYLLVILIVMAKTYPLLLAFELRSYVAIFLIVCAALLTGQLVGPSRPEDQTALAIACANRNPGLAMLIASLNFPAAGAIHVLVPYLFAASLPSMFYVQWRKHKAAPVTSHSSRP